ncbi:MAG: hypothetical protein AB7I18_08045 [Candidatus Berkiella sp.]
MSSFNENQETFATHVVAKQLAVPAHAMQSRYNRIYFTRRICEWLFSAILIFGGQEFLLKNGLYSPVWPAAGVGLSALFLRGDILVLGIFTGTFASYLFNHFPLTVSLANSLMFTLNLYLIRVVCLRFFGSIAPMHSTRVCLQFVLVTLFFCALHTGWQYLFYPDLPWLMAFIGESNGILCLTPLCLSLEPFVVKRLFVKGSLCAWLFGGAIVLGHTLFFFLPATWAIALAAALFVALCLYANHFRAASTGMLLLGISVVYLSGAQDPFQLFQDHYSLNVVLWILGLFSVSTIAAILLSCRCTQADFMAKP